MPSVPRRGLICSCATNTAVRIIPARRCTPPGSAALSKSGAIPQLTTTCSFCNPSNHLNSFKTSASFAYGSDNTVVFTGGYFNIRGSADAALYGPGTAANSASASPDSSGWTAELAYIQFGMSAPKAYPWFNARLGLQFNWYNKFNGASTNYDGMGTNASANNTVVAYGQFTF